MPGRGRHLCQLGTCRGRCRRRAARRSGTPWQPPVGTDRGCWDPRAAETLRGLHRGIWAWHSKGQLLPREWQLPTERPHHASSSVPALGLCSSLCHPQRCPAASGAWLLLLLPPVRHPWSPQVTVTVTGTAQWPLGSPEQQEGFTAHGVGTGGTHGHMWVGTHKHVCPWPGSSGMKEWPTVPA